MDSEYVLKPIGRIRSCYTEKFGIPRQPGLVQSATTTLKLCPPFNTVEALRGIDQFSHLWILFVFHQSTRNTWKPTVRPPRLGGNERIGVFASRSNFRPNPIGLSVVELHEVKGTTLKLGGGDFLDQTPVLDIKPYIPYADSIPAAKGAFAEVAPLAPHQVKFSSEAHNAVEQFENEERPALRQLITDMLAYNPRPAYQNNDPERTYGTSLFDLNIRWKQHENTITIIGIKPTQTRNRPHDKC